MLHMLHILPLHVIYLLDFLSGFVLVRAIACYFFWLLVFALVFGRLFSIFLLGEFSPYEVI